MKLGWDMYHLNTFHLEQNEGGSEWAGGGCIQKTIKKSHEINIISSLTSNKNSLKKAMKIGVFLQSYLTVWLYCSQGLGMGGGGQPPIRGVLLT